MEGRFCGNCGHVLDAPALPAAAPNAPQMPAMQWANTQMDPSPHVPSVPPVAPVASPRAAMRTMIGTPVVAPPQPAAAPAAAVAAQPAPVVSHAHRTMMGMAIQPPPSAPVAPAAPAAFNAHRTMMGVATNAAPAAPISGVANAQSTMMGVVSPIAAPVAPSAPKRGEMPPMMGGSRPGVPPREPASGSPTQILADGSRDSLDDYDPLGRNKRKPRTAGESSSRTGLWIGVGVLVAAALGSAIWFGLRGRGTEAVAALQAQVEANEGGALAMTVAIPGQPAGTVVRYGRQEQHLDAQGRARFVLDDLGSRVGAIDLPIDVNAPNAAPSRRTARIVLAYRVDPDLAGLAGESPTLRLMFHVAPGSQLRVDGQTIATDATGAGAAVEAVTPMPIDGPAVRERTLHVDVRGADGTAASGTYTLRVPRAQLTLDRPPIGSVTTSAERMVVRGNAAGASRLTVNGIAAAITNGTFETAISLPAPGHVPLDVVAYSTTAAPASAHIDVERIAATDRAAIDRFLATNTGTIAELAAGSLATGKRIHLSGHVLGAPRDHEGGRTFQLLVNDRGCPGGRCLAWVDTEPTTRALAADAAVDVVGYVSGRRSSVTANGERRSDVVLHAVALR